MYAETPGRLVLAGPFGEPDAGALTAYCRQLGRLGQDRVVLDVGAVTRCDRAGLASWGALARGVEGLMVVVEGARWSQFLDLLRLTPVEDLSRVCDDIRALVPVTDGRPVPRPPRAGSGGPRRARATGPTGAPATDAEVLPAASQAHGVVDGAGAGVDGLRPEAPGPSRVVDVAAATPRV